MRRRVLVLALLIAGTNPAHAQPLPPRTPFVAMLGKARLDADCYPQGCRAVPTMYDPAELPSDRYSAEFSGVLLRFLLDVRFRGRVDPTFTRRDRGLFDVSLGALEPYLMCLERRFTSAAAENYADRASVDRLASAVRRDCRVARDLALRKLAFAGPDFDTFDPLRDGGKPHAQVSELLQQIQQFALAYHAGLHSVEWTPAVALFALPKPTSPSKRSQ